MDAVEFIVELDGAGVLAISRDVADRLPKTGRARVLVLTEPDDDADWRTGAYQQFLRDDSAEDDVYQSLR